MKGGFSSSGLAGMGFPGLQAYPTTMLVENMYNQGLIDNEMYMFNLLNTNYSKDKNYQNGVIFGLADIQTFMTTNYSLISWVPVTQLQKPGSTT